MRRKPFTRDELMHLKFLLKTRDKLSEKETTEQIANLIQSQKSLPHPTRNPKSATFQEEFRKIKQSKTLHKDSIESA